MNTIIITGASGKIGRLLAEYFLNKHSKVVAIVSSEKSSVLLKNTFPEFFDKKELVVFQINLLDERASENLLIRLKGEGIKPNALVNCARSVDNIKLEKGERVSSDNFLKEFSLGVVAPYQLSVSLAQCFPESFHSVVNISSMYGVVAHNSHLYDGTDIEPPIHYSVAKAAVIHLSKELSVRLAYANVRVNTVSYGGVEGRVDNDFLEKYAALCPAQRMLSDQDLCGPVEFLLSEKASGMTGHNLVVDGGWSIW